MTDQELQQKINAIYDDAEKEAAWAESYEEIFQIFSKGQQKIEELYNQ